MESGELEGVEDNDEKGSKESLVTWARSTGPESGLPLKAERGKHSAWVTPERRPPRPMRCRKEVRLGAGQPGRRCRCCRYQCPAPGSNWRRRSPHWPPRSRPPHPCAAPGRGSSSARTPTLRKVSSGAGTPRSVRPRCACYRTPVTCECPSRSPARKLRAVTRSFRPCIGVTSASTRRPPPAWTITAPAVA